jgi:hypothetical protein
MAKNQADLAINWLLDSKIHNNDVQDKGTFGSFNNYYDIRKKSCQYAYTEITAYGVELLLYLYEKSGDAVYLQNAQTAGDWITKMQYEGEDEKCRGGYLHCFYLADRKKDFEAYPFDAGIILGALSELYEKTKNIYYLNSAAKGAKWLIEKMQNLDGSFRPLYSLSERNFHVEASRNKHGANLRNSWYYFSGCHHGKIAIGLLKYYSASKEPKTLESASSLLNGLLPNKIHGVISGSLKLQISFSLTHIVTPLKHCYLRIRLSMIRKTLNDQKLFNSALLAGDWLVSPSTKGR